MSLISSTDLWFFGTLGLEVLDPEERRGVGDAEDEDGDESGQEVGFLLPPLLLCSLPSFLLTFSSWSSFFLSGTFFFPLVLTMVICEWTGQEVERMVVETRGTDRRETSNN